jgi:hypothetical protein
VTQEYRPSHGVRAKKQAATANFADTAYVVGAILGSDLPLEALMEGLQARLEALRDPLSPAAASELQRHLVVLDSLFLRFSVEATRTRKGSTHQTLLLRAALQAQQAHSRTFALLHTLAMQRKGGVPAIELHDHDDERTDQ